MDLFEEVDSEQMFHMIDTIIADNAVEDGHFDGNLTEIRVKINSIHGKNGGSDFRDSAPKASTSPKNRAPVYLEATEDGFPGLEPPVG